MINLNVKERDVKKSLEKLREQDIIPGVIYGQGSEAISVCFDRMEFIQIYREFGESSIITLKGLNKDMEVVIKDFQLNPINEQLLHVDFMTVVADEAITIYVPIIYTGVSGAVDRGEGTFTSVDEIEISALPKNLPHEIKVDISVLEKVGDSIHLNDITLPDGVTALDANISIASISALVEEPEEEGSTEIDFSQITASKEKDEVEKEEE